MLTHCPVPGLHTSKLHSSFPATVMNDGIEHSKHLLRVSQVTLKVRQLILDTKNQNIIAQTIVPFQILLRSNHNAFLVGCEAPLWAKSMEPLYRTILQLDHLNHNVGIESTTCARSSVALRIPKVQLESFGLHCHREQMMPVREQFPLLANSCIDWDVPPKMACRQNMVFPHCAGGEQHACANSFPKVQVLL